MKKKPSLSKLYRKNGYDVDHNGVAVHIFNYKQAYGKIPKGWHIHHLNGNKLDNDPINLIAVTPGVHKWIHELQKKTGVYLDRKEVESELLYFREKIASFKKKRKELKNELDRIDSAIETMLNRQPQMRPT